jgi:sugar phosphate permease
MALWSAILAAFMPFANVYLSRDLHLPLEQIGLVFSVAQLLQLGSGLLVPLLLRWLGMIEGIVATQLAAAIALAAMACAHHLPLAVGLYLAFSACQWMSSPGLYSLLMNETPESERSTAAACTMFANSLVGSVATAAAGALFAQFGYRGVLLALAFAAAAVALLCRLLLTQKNKPESSGNPAELVISSGGNCG